MFLGQRLALTVDQLGIVVPELEKAMDAYVVNFGVRFQVFEVDDTMSQFSGSTRRFRVRFGLGQVGGLSVELIQPVSGRTIHQEFLKHARAGIHHLGFYTLDLKATRRKLDNRGYKVLMEGRIDGVAEFAYYEAHDLHCIVEPLKLSSQLPAFLACHSSIYPKI
jgi:4-hydroxyphenylpyruvate dioxygenase-like putative hemolysin